jgi:glycosyltransferase involved in cell wall biosynthesis
MEDWFGVEYLSPVHCSGERGPNTHPRPSMSAGTVIHVCDYGAPYLGNFMPSQLAVADAVRDRLGLDARFVFPTRARGRPWLAELDRRGFEFSFLEKEIGRVRRARELRTLARAHRAVILHSHFFAFDLDCAAAAASTPCRVIWHVHSGLEEYTLRNRLTDLIKVRLVGRRCDLAVCVSEAAAADSRRRGFPSPKVRVIPNGIVLGRFEEPRDRDDARRQLGLAPDDFAVLSFCWTPHRKGADLVIAAMEVLRRPEGAPRAVALLTGEARTRDYIRGIYGDTLPEWLRILEPVEDVALLFAAADVFVSAAREDAFSYAIGEAMAAGLPVISSDIPGPSHYFVAGGVRTFPTENAGALGAEIATIIASPDRRALGEENRRFAFASLGIDHYVDRVIGAYTQLLSSAQADSGTGRMTAGTTSDAA